MVKMEKFFFEVIVVGSGLSAKTTIVSLFKKGIIPFWIENIQNYKINDDRKVMGIKIDTEGEDYKVLLGAKNIIKNNLPDILIEVREENKLLIREFLITFGYNFFALHDKLVVTDMIDLQISESINIYASTRYQN